MKRSVLKHRQKMDFQQKREFSSHGWKTKKKAIGMRAQTTQQSPKFQACSKPTSSTFLLVSYRNICWSRKFPELTPPVLGRWHQLWPPAISALSRLQPGRGLFQVTERWHLDGTRCQPGACPVLQNHHCPKALSPHYCNRQVVKRQKFGKDLEKLLCFSSFINPNKARGNGAA